MKILILEDSTRRRAWFTKALMVRHDVRFAVCYSEAVKLYPRHSWDVIFLDHDLHPSHYGLYMLADDATYRAQMAVVEPKTGFHFATFLTQRGKPCPTIIHTMNPAGQQAMKALLPWALVMSFDKFSNGYEWDPKQDIDPAAGEAVIQMARVLFDSAIQRTLESRS